MKKHISGILAYFYILIFKRKIKSDYPCKASPFFLMRLDRKLKHIHLGSAFIGRDVKISTGCKFFENPIIYGKVNINKYTSINGPGTRIFAHLNHIKIGSFCSIASNVIIQEYNHDYKYISTYNFSNEIFGFKTENISSKGGIEIQDDVWIGSNSVILSGVTIGRGSIIGAGSIVTKDIPPYSIAAGNPAVVMKKRFSEATIDYIEKLEWWKWDENTIQKKKHLFTNILDINMIISGKGE